MPPVPKLTKDRAIIVSLGTTIAALIAVATGTWGLAVEVATWKAMLKSTCTIHEVDAAWRDAEKLNPGFNAPDVMAIRKRYAQATEIREQQPSKPLADVKAAN